MMDKSPRSELAADVFDYDNIPIGYYDHVFAKGRGIQSYWHHNKFKEVKNRLRQYQVNSVLDIACGPGTFLGNYCQEFNCVGIDVAEGQIRYASERYASKSCKFVPWKADDYRLSSEWDAVTLIEFIEHISQWETSDILSVVCQKLSTSGVVVLTTPNCGSPWRLVEWLIYKFAKGLRYDQQHVTRWKKDELNRFLARQNFKVNEMTGIIGLAPFFAAFSWRLAKMVERVERPLVRRWGFLILAVIRPRV
jgi:2-polyprenyl-3-methyl-5-hydroxy-6-metoxy-1,4-benzoquinol methylase